MSQADSEIVMGDLAIWGRFFPTKSVMGNRYIHKCSEVPPREIPIFVISSERKSEHSGTYAFPSRGNQYVPECSDFLSEEITKFGISLRGKYEHSGTY